MTTDKEEHFRNALSNYMGVLNLRESDLAKKLEEADRGLAFPENPIDVLDYMGNIEPLEMTESEKHEERSFLHIMLERYGATCVWETRMRYKLEWYYVEKIL